MNWRIEVGDCRDVLRSLPAQSVHTVVTSPPYFGLRDYGTGEWEGGDPACDHAPRALPAETRKASSGLEGGHAAIREGDLGHGARSTCPCGARRVDRQIGLEPTPDEFVAALVAVFREVRRVLRDDGTVWLNLGDSYNNRAVNRPSSHQEGLGFTSEHLSTSWRDHAANGRARMSIENGDLKEKDLLGVPWMVAFALRADGWYLRSDIIWSKPNPMPESVTDRPTKSHEYVFLLSKGPRYFYDADAIREPHDDKNGLDRFKNGGVSRDEYVPETQGWNGGGMKHRHREYNPAGRNKRSVWTVATQPYAGAHFATFPPKLIEPCILAGAPERACGECGAPWVRVVEKGPPPPEPTHRDPAKRLEPGQAGNVGAGNMGFRASRLSGQEMAAWREAHPDRTLGFESSCSHGDGSARGVVLDPFAGAGTTGLVALQHGRDFIGIELNPEYAAMARDRIETAVRLGFRSPQNGGAPIDGQLDIFAALDGP